MVLTRKELYDLLWAKPAGSLIKKYNISYTGLQTICKDMNIPVPANGHWQKIKFGKEVSVSPLPSDYSGEEQVTLVEKQEGESKSMNVLSPASVLQHEIENDKRLTLTVPGKLTNPHKLIVAVREDLAEKGRYYDHGLAYSHRGKLSIKAAPDNVGRALRFMDTLIKNMDERGHVTKVEDGGSYIVIEGEKIKISLREKINRTPKPSTHSWKEYDWSPSGILIFSIDESYRAKVWQDGKVLLEDQMSKIIAALELKAKHEKEAAIEREKYWAEAEAKRKIEQQREQQKQKELAELKELFSETDQWHKANILRSYIDDVEAKAGEHGLTDEVREWLSWARKKAEDADMTLQKLRELSNAETRGNEEED